MTYEQTIDAIQSAADRAKIAAAKSVAAEGRGNPAGALALVAEAEAALQMALSGLAHARGLLRE